MLPERKQEENAFSGFNCVTIEADSFNSEFFLIQCICYLNKNLNLVF